MPSPYLNDPDFVKAPPDQQRAYLMSVDPDFAKAPPQEQQAYLSSLAPQDPRSTGTRLYQSVVKPLTDYLGQGMEAATTPLVGMARMAQGEPAKTAFGPETWQSVGQGGAAADTRRQAAEVVVPQTPMQAGIMAGTAAAGPASRALPALAKVPALARILGGTVGGAAGGAVEDPTATGALTGAAWGAGTTAAGEGAGKVLQTAAKWGPGAKNAVNEEAARRLTDVAQTVNPSAGPVIAAAKQGLKPMRGAKTPAALQESVLGGSLQDAASKRMDQTITSITQSAPTLRFAGPDLQQAYAAMPDLAKQQLVGGVGPQGFTLPQAQAVRGWLGSGAFSQSPVGQGVGSVPQQKLWDSVTQEIEGALASHPLASQILPQWQKGNKEYGGLMVLQDMLSGQNAFTGGPNRIALNTPNIQQWLSTNRQDASRRMGGPQQFEAMSNAVTGGGQLGTRDVLTPGFGGMLDALRQTYGRGQGGAPQIAGSLIRTGAPNIGSQYTGNRTPLQLPPVLQQALDAVLQRQAGQVTP